MKTVWVVADLLLAWCATYRKMLDLLGHQGVYSNNKTFECAAKGIRRIRRIQYKQ